MFGLKKKTDYGLELMVALAKNYKKGPMSLRKIAKDRKLPYKFLGQMAFEFRQYGLIEAKEGSGGGYFLTVSPAKISVAKILEILEGPVELGSCFGCPKVQSCGQKDVWTEVGDQVRKALKGKMLADLIKSK